LLIRLEEFDLDERRAEADAKLQARQAELERLQNGFREEEKAQEGGAYKEHGKTEEEAKEQRQRVLMGLYHRRKFQH
jgi:hypothetical protein